MVKSKDDEQLVQMRALVTHQLQRVYQLYGFMVGFSEELEDDVIQVFQLFNQRYRRALKKREPGWEPDNLPVRLFHLVQGLLRDRMASHLFDGGIGRDTRRQITFEENLLEAWSAWKKNKSVSVPWSGFAERLLAIDFDFRAPLVLRDILSFSDEQTVKILGIRWGVYRHRLHRGRLDAVALLKGKSNLPVQTKSKPEESAVW